MNFSREMIEKAKTASSAEELLEMAKAENVELTAEEAKQYYSFLHEKRELTDEELSIVAGGKGKPTPPPPKYQKGQLLWVAYISTHSYVGIQILWPEFYTEDYGWRYYVRDELGFDQNYYLDEWIVKTYKPQKWEEG